MKSTCILLLVLWQFFSIELFAQVPLQEGVVEFNIQYPNLTSSQSAQIDLQPKSLSVYFKQQNARIELYTLSGRVVSIYNHDSGAVWQLTEMLGKKMAIRNSLQKIERIENENNLKTGREFHAISKTKRIAGFKCRGIEVSEKTTNGLKKTVYWVSSSLPSVGLNYMGTDSLSKGMLLDFYMNNDGLEMHLIAKEIKKITCQPEWFEIPRGYEKVNGDGE